MVIGNRSTPDCCRLLVAVLVASLLLSGAVKASVKPKEYQIKAACIYNFVRFTTWPDSVFSDSTSPFLIGILGADPFGSDLDQMVTEKRVDGRPIKIIRSHELSEMHQCQLVFISTSELSRLGSVIESLGPLHMTVSEISSFIDEGGIANFYTDGFQVRFEISPEAAENAGLDLSSRLLRIARVVEPGRRGGAR